MAIVGDTQTHLHLLTRSIFGRQLPRPFESVSFPVRVPSVRKLVVVAKRHGARKESPKIQNRRMQKKGIIFHTMMAVPSNPMTRFAIERFNGTPTRPRLSVFCSTKQLYAMLVDDSNKKCLFYGSTLQKSIRDDPSCTTSEAAKRVGEELIKACIDLKINEISSYDRNGGARGERMQAFEIAISRHGFLPR